ncbi:MAG: radical SAM protein [Acidobacteriota bacterium]
MQLVGIARAAHAAPVLEAKRRVHYRQLATGRWINRVEGGRHSFGWSINPYRGCEMACQYCYARYTHEFMELDGGEDFETLIFAKQWNAREFRRELERVPMEEAIAIGTATDPYQHAERRYELTRRMLEVFATVSGRRIWITTKSDLVVRDLSVLQRVARRNVVSVNLTVTTLDVELARGLEPKAPRPDLRLAAVAALTGAGIQCGVIASPVMPGLNDREEDLKGLAVGARAAGALWFGGGVLFLKSPTREVFQQYLEREAPWLAGRYERAYWEQARLPRAYQERVEGVFERLRAFAGLSRKATPYRPPDWEAGRQMVLGL